MQFGKRIDARRDVRPTEDHEESSRDGLVFVEERRCLQPPRSKAGCPCTSRHKPRRWIAHWNTTTGILGSRVNRSGKRQPERSYLWRDLLRGGRKDGRKSRSRGRPSKLRCRGGHSQESRGVRRSRKPQSTRAGRAAERQRVEQNYASLKCPTAMETTTASDGHCTGLAHDPQCNCR